MKIRNRTIAGASLACAAAMVLPSCVHVKTDPIEIKPIHIVADINVKVERQLDDFFAFEKQQPATAPAAQQ